MKYSVYLLLFVFVTACNLDSAHNEVYVDPIDYKALNDKQITDYLTTNNIEAEKTESGLYYTIENLGDGEQPTATSNVTVAYKGYYLNGTVFDQSQNDGTTFALNRVIKGWTEGIPYFKEGGNGTLFIPSHLAYGSYNYNGIPGGSVLIFDVKLLSVN
ncbi:FKBP-type peptidyl-prolyl cis-trans isomerase [Maribacter sp. X9]|uniref:FKBP-type peptidyl-prolyl cis-trans isomerase n=1 Tax=Maribacter sp. X9 TaxID=3402159 RepID=UPI003AF36399